MSTTIGRDWTTQAQKIALENVVLEHSGVRVGDRGDACTAVPPSAKLHTQRFLTDLGVESLTHALLTSDGAIEQDDTTSATLFTTLFARRDDAHASRTLATDVFTRILTLRKALRRLRKLAATQGNKELQHLYSNTESRATEAIVSAVGTLKRRASLESDKPGPSSSNANNALQATTGGASIAERSASLVDMNSPEAGGAGGGSAFDLTEEVTPHLFATVDAARSLRSFSFDVAASSVENAAASTTEAISNAPLSVVRDYIAHRRNVALWLSNTASRALDDYVAEKASDFETRSTLDTERGKLSGMAAQIDAFIAGQQRERLEIEVDHACRLEATAVERTLVSEALAHERSLNKTLETEVKELRARLQSLRNQITAGEARTAQLTKRHQVLADESASLEASFQCRMQDVELAIRDGELRQWLAHLACSFVTDLASQAAQVNSDVLQRQESRLRSLYGKVAESITEAMERSKDLVARLGAGRSQLADFLGMSPLSTTSTVTDFRSATPVPAAGVAVAAAMTESVVSPDATPGLQTPNASSRHLFGETMNNNNNSSFSSTDTVACGKDVLKVMSRVAAAAEDLWNRLGDLNERWQKEELALGANTDLFEKRMEQAYETMTSLIDSTRGDALESAYGTRLPYTRSLDDVEDSTGAQARRPRKGLPQKLARTTKSSTVAATTASGTPRVRAAVDAHEGYLPTPPPPPSVSAAPRVTASDDLAANPTAPTTATWVTFVAQFRSAFGDGVLGF